MSKLTGRRFLFRRIISQTAAIVYVASPLNSSIQHFALKIPVTVFHQASFQPLSSPVAAPNFGEECAIHSSLNTEAPGGQIKKVPDYPTKNDLEREGHLLPNREAKQKSFMNVQTLQII